MHLCICVHTNLCLLFYHRFSSVSCNSHFFSGQLFICFKCHFHCVSWRKQSYSYNIRSSLSIQLFNRIHPLYFKYFYIYLYYKIITTCVSYPSKNRHEVSDPYLGYRQPLFGEYWLIIFDDRLWIVLPTISKFIHILLINYLFTMVKNEVIDYKIRHT